MLLREVNFKVIILFSRGLTTIADSRLTFDANDWILCVDKFKALQVLPSEVDLYEKAWNCQLSLRQVNDNLSTENLQLSAGVFHVTFEKP